MEEKDKSYTAYNAELTKVAREMRKNQTRQEAHLWYDFLKDYPEKFTRQRPIAHYVADFYCSRAKLVVELDGSHHFSMEGMTYDIARTEVMNDLGVEVIRFSNDQLDRFFDDVCAEIDRVVQERIAVLERT